MDTHIRTVVAFGIDLAQTTTNRRPTARLARPAHPVH